MTSLLRTPFVLFLIVAVATFSVSVKLAEASFWSGFFTILAGILTIALVVLTGGSALAFLGFCPVCGLVTSFGGLSAATITGGVACAEGLICGGIAENRFAIISPEVGACSSDVGIRFYETLPPGGDYDTDELALYRFTRGQETIDPRWRDYKLMRWITGTDGSGTHSDIGRGAYYGSATYGGNIDFFDVSSKAFTGYYDPGLGVEPWKRVKYKDVCSRAGVCSVLDQSAPANSYTLYAAKRLTSFSDVLPAQIVSYPIVKTGEGAPYLRYNDGRIPLQDIGGNYEFTWNGKRYSGTNTINIVNSELAGYPVRYLAVNGRAKFNSGELPEQFDCNGVQYAAQDGALTIPVGALAECRVVEHRAWFSGEAPFSERQKLLQAGAGTFFFYWNDGIVPTPSRDFFVKDRVTVASELVNGRKVFRLSEFFMDGGRVSYVLDRGYAYNSGRTVFSPRNYRENPAHLALENKFLSAAQGEAATLPYFDVGAYEDCKDEHGSSDCRRAAGAWYRPGTLFAGPFKVDAPPAEQCPAAAAASAQNPAAIVTVASRGCNFATLFVATRNADVYDVARDGVIIASNIPAAQNEYNDTGLAPLTGYNYSVIARRGNESAESATALAQTDACAGAPAATITRAEVQCTAVRLIVDAQNADALDLIRDDVVIRANMPADTNAIDDENLNEQTTYNYRVRARNGGRAADSATVAATTLNCASNNPSAVLSLDGLAACNAIDLNVSATNADTYDVERDGAVIAADVPAAQTQYRDIAVAPLVEYVYRAIAERSGLPRRPSNTLNVRTPACAALEAAVQVTGSGCDYNELRIDTNGAETYDILRNGVAIAVGVEASRTQYRDGGLARSTNYDYRVVARAADGRSALSPAATGRTTCLPQCSFGANPLNIVRGETSRLGWTCERVDSCSLLGGNVPASGFRDVAPTRTTSYTLSCVNEDGSINPGATVQVSSPGFREVAP